IALSLSSYLFRQSRPSPRAINAVDMLATSSRIMNGLETPNRVLRLGAIYSVNFSDFKIRFIERALQSFDLFASVRWSQSSRRQLRAKLVRFPSRRFSANVGVCLFTRQAIDCQTTRRLEPSNPVRGIASKVRIDAVILGPLIRIKW